MFLFNVELDTDAMAAPAVMVEPYDIPYKSPSAAIMKTTAPYMSHSMQRGTSIIDAQSSAGITKTTTSYALPSAVEMMTPDMNTAVYFAVTDAQSSADIVKTTTLYASLSDVLMP